MNGLKAKESSILEASFDLIADKGFSKTSMQDIANLAQVGKGTIYEYFSCKEDVFLKGYLHAASEFLCDLEQTVFQYNQFEDQLNSMIEFIQSATEKRACKIRLLIREGRENLKEPYFQKMIEVHTSIRTRCVDILSKILKLGISEKKIEVDEIELVSRVLMQFVFSVMTSFSLEESEQDSKVHLRACLINLILNGINKKQERVTNEEI